MYFDPWRAKELVVCVCGETMAQNEKPKPSDAKLYRDGWFRHKLFLFECSVGMWMLEPTERTTICILLASYLLSV